MVDHPKSLLKSKKKLTFYTIFKTENKKPELLDYTENPRQKKVTDKFPLGNHKLRIGTSISTIPKTCTAEHLRICQLCNTDTENETYFLLKCNAYHDIRKNYFNKISGI